MEDFVLRMEDISKSFPGVRALKGVSLRVKSGEVHGLVGENGAGKSTLLKILNGNHKKDSGEIYIDGKKVSITSPKVAQELGVAIIFQELNLVPMLTIAENMFINQMDSVTNRGIVSWKKMYDESRELLKRIGFDVDTRKKVSELTVAERQMVEIARAVSFKAKIILMDEPSATLTVKELNNLFNVIRELKKRNVTVIYISHRLEEVIEICDSVTIMRDGEVIDTKPIGQTSIPEIITKMVGREVTDIYPKRDNYKTDEEILRVENLSTKDRLKNLNFSLKKGEILGFAGLVGSGRTEMARAIFGVDYVSSMKLYRDGKLVKITRPDHAIQNGMAFITEDRKGEGLVLDFSVAMNLTMASVRKLRKGLFLSRRREKEISSEMVDQLSVKTPSLLQKVINLSGGNQQKIVVGKWLIADADIYIMDEPTRGIDVGAKHEIYVLMNELIKKGKSIIFISSELPELIGMSDRLIVMYEGEIKGELTGEDMTAVNVMQLCK